MSDCERLTTKSSSGLICLKNNSEAGIHEAVNKLSRYEDLEEDNNSGDKLISLSDLQGYPIRFNHYDKEHGNFDFICGIESVLEWAESLPYVKMTLKEANELKKIR